MYGKMSHFKEFKTNALFVCLDLYYLKSENQHFILITNLIGTKYIIHYVLEVRTLYGMNTSPETIRNLIDMNFQL